MAYCLSVLFLVVLVAYSLNQNIQRGSCLSAPSLNGYYSQDTAIT